MEPIDQPQTKGPNRPHILAIIQYANMQTVAINIL